MTSHLFLYGTLLPELAHASLRGELLRLEPVGTGFVRGHLYDLGAYPGLVLDRHDAGKVTGALFRLPDDERQRAEILAALDRYEDAVASDAASGLFARRCETVIVPPGEECEAWVYVYQRDSAGAIRIPHGDYRRWLRERSLST